LLLLLFALANGTKRTGVKPNRSQAIPHVWSWDRASDSGEIDGFFCKRTLAGFFESLLASFRVG